MVDADTVKILLYLLELEGAHMGGKKKGYLVKGRPCAFPDHYLLYSPLADPVHVATQVLPPGLQESHVAGERGAPQWQTGGCDRLAAPRSWGSISLPPGLHWEAEHDSSADLAALPSPVETLPWAG